LLVTLLSSSYRGLLISLISACCQRIKSGCHVTRASTDSDQESMEGLMDRVNDEHSADAEFGGREARQRLERKLLRKLDARMSILVLIYILNYVRLSSSLSGFTSLTRSFAGRPE
jgi:hypothetical protein